MQLHEIPNSPQFAEKPDFEGESFRTCGPYRYKWTLFDGLKNVGARFRGRDFCRWQFSGLPDRKSAKPSKSGDPMRGVAVQGTEEHDAGIRPDEAARKRVAVELIRNHDRPLGWTARRYSICPGTPKTPISEASRSFLSKAPTTDTRHLLPWTRKVIKHEALAIRRTRERTLARPGQSDIDSILKTTGLQLIPDISDGPDELTVRREGGPQPGSPDSAEAPGTQGPDSTRRGILIRRNRVDELVDPHQGEPVPGRRAGSFPVPSGKAKRERCPEFEPMISASCD